MCGLAGHSDESASSAPPSGTPHSGDGNDGVGEGAAATAYNASGSAADNNPDHARTIYHASETPPESAGEYKAASAHGHDVEAAKVHANALIESAQLHAHSQVVAAGRLLLGLALLGLFTLLGLSLLGIFIATGLGSLAERGSSAVSDNVDKLGRGVVSMAVVSLLFHGIKSLVGSLSSLVSRSAKRRAAS